MPLPLTARERRVSAHALDQMSRAKLCVRWCVCPRRVSSRFWRAHPMDMMCAPGSSETWNSWTGLRDDGLEVCLRVAIVGIDVRIRLEAACVFWGSGRGAVGFH